EMPYMDRDGVVWMVDFVAAGAWLPPPLARVLRDNFAVGFSVEMLEKAFPQVSLLEGQKGQLPEFVIFFEPPSLDARIINQFGLFSLMNKPLADLATWLEEGLRRNPKLARKIIVPASLKWQVRDKLDQMNLSERVMYPGLDGLSLWLKRWYSAK